MEQLQGCKEVSIDNLETELTKYITWDAKKKQKYRVWIIKI